MYGNKHDWTFEDMKSFEKFTSTRYLIKGQRPRNLKKHLFIAWSH